MQQQVQVTGMHCLDCAVKVKNALETLPGVKRADVKYVRKTATLEVDAAIPTAMLAARKGAAGIRR